MSDHTAMLEATATALTDIAKAIMTTLMHTRVGVRTHDASAVEEEDRAEAWLRYREWLQEQIADYRTAATAQSDDKHVVAAPAVAPHDIDSLGTDESTADELHDAIDIAKQELAGASTEAYQKQLLMDRLAVSHHISQEMLQSQASTSDGDPLRKGVQYRDKLCTDVLRFHARAIKQKAKIDEVRKLNLRKLTQNRALMGQLEEHTSARRHRDKQVLASEGGSDLLRSTAKSMETQRSRYEILRNVYEALVVESGVAWADKPGIRKILLD